MRESGCKAGFFLIKNLRSKEQGRRWKQDIRVRNQEERGIVLIFALRRFKRLRLNLTLGERRRSPVWYLSVDA